MNILCFGATSGIAVELLRLYAAVKPKLWLIARNAEKLNILARDLKARGAAETQVHAIDLNLSSGHQGLCQKVFEEAGGFDLVILAQGTLQNQTKIQTQADTAKLEIVSNFLAPAEILVTLTPYLEKQKFGKLVIFGSVAGDRGRQSNYVYGSAKAGLHAFVEGLRARLFRSGISVILVKPGPTQTQMTEGLPGASNFATPQKVAKIVKCGISRNAAVIYAPGVFRFIMLIIKHLPTCVMKRLKI